MYVNSKISTKILSYFLYHQKNILLKINNHGGYVGTLLNFSLYIAIKNNSGD